MSFGFLNRRCHRVEQPYSGERTVQGRVRGEVAGVVCRLMRHHFAVGNFSLDDSFVEDLGLD